MARYNAQLLSPAAIAADTAFAWFGYTAQVARIRRVTLGVSTTTAIVPTSQQVRVGFNITTAGSPATPVSATANKLDPQSGTNGVNLIASWGTAPTLTVTANDQYGVAFNTQSGADLPWELLEEWRTLSSTTGGIAIVNRLVALPAGHQISLAMEWEE